MINMRQLEDQTVMLILYRLVNELHW